LARFPGLKAGAKRNPLKRVESAEADKKRARGEDARVLTIYRLPYIPLVGVVA
jgi:hypothetical protein